MNLSQIIDEVNKDIDDSLDSESIIGWVNRCLDDLTPITKKEEIKLADVNAENSYDLPDDFVEMALLRVNGSELPLIPIRDNQTEGYKMWSNKLFLQPAAESGEIELYYYRRLTHLVTGTDIPEIEPTFHDLLVLYAVGHSQFADEEPERQQDAMARYLARKEEYRDFMMRNTSETYQISIMNPFL